MNSYDYNYNGNMIDAQSAKNRLILHLVGLKWINYFLVGSTIFQFFFFVGFSVFSVFLCLFIFYLAFSFISLARKDPLSVEFEFMQIYKKLSLLNVLLIIAVILSLADAVYSYIAMRTYVIDLYYSGDFFQKNFAIFIVYVLTFRIGFLSFLRFYNRIDEENQNQFS